ERRVIPDVKPGYMRELLPEAAPTEPEDWEEIFNDIEKIIMPGVNFCYHPSYQQMLKNILNLVQQFNCTPGCQERQNSAAEGQAGPGSGRVGSQLNTGGLRFRSGEEEGLWLHVDAAYAGSAYFCPELRWSLEGIEFTQSFVFNPSKWMMVHFDCTAFCLTQELLRRLTRSGIMYLIPAEIQTKRIIRFTVTSQFTTADDILKDWTFISKTACTLLAEKHSFNNADQLRSGTKKTKGKEENPDPHLDAMAEEKEDVVTQLEKAQVDLWIDKAWNRPRRPMRSLSCNSEPLPYWTLFSFDCETTPGLQDGSDGLRVPSATESGSLSMITEMPSNLPGKQVLKKLTKFYSVPSFCNQWAQCSRHQLSCPLKVSHGSQKTFSTTHRRMNSMPSSPAANTSPSTSPLESANGAQLQ
ncbi:hypothetical protein GOODEAATRI_020740, partial [Goodea atripinnis]